MKQGLNGRCRERCTPIRTSRQAECRAAFKTPPSRRFLPGLVEVSFDTWRWLVSVSRKCASEGLRQPLKRVESFGKHLCMQGVNRRQTPANMCSSASAALTRRVALDKKSQRFRSFLKEVRLACCARATGLGRRNREKDCRYNIGRDLCNFEIF